jgi:selenobiotic family peptide radical SAM maturase
MAAATEIDSDIVTEDHARVDGVEWALVWRDPDTAETRLAAATAEELFVLKVLAEDVSVPDAASQGGSSVEAIEWALHRAGDKGLILRPPSRLSRDPAALGLAEIPRRFCEVRGFTVQWHITNDCDLHCRHCYDRDRHSRLTLLQGLTFLEDLAVFSRHRRVRGHVSFTGGNPFLSPHFLQLYEHAVRRGFATSILGNPAPRGELEKIVSVKRPDYFQVSLEGLPQHNDFIRGTGQFARVIEFLGVLRDLGVPSTVMLTLTNDNLAQVLPLADRLRGHADHFTFNRLSPVGEGAALAMPDPERYAGFVEAYVAAADQNPILGFKDNLINAVLDAKGREPFGGCTGFGCGAAFSSFAVLPDGEVHACRKFPSRIGNILYQRVGEVYDSARAALCRRGSLACRGCDLRAACGGCLAIADGLGLDFSVDRDPYCRWKQAAEDAFPVAGCTPCPQRERRTEQPVPELVAGG